MKKNKLYTVNKWNKKRLLLAGGYTDLTGQSIWTPGTPANVRDNAAVFFDDYSQSPVSVQNNVTQLGVTTSKNSSDNIARGTGDTAISTGEEGSGGHSDAETSRNYNGKGFAPNYINYNTGSTIGNGVKSLLEDLSSTGASGSGSYANYLMSSLSPARLTAPTVAYTGIGGIGSSLIPNYSKMIAEQAAESLGNLGKGLSSTGASTGSSLGSLGNAAVSEGGKAAGKSFASLLGADKLSSGTAMGLGIGAQVVGGLGKSALSHGLNTKTGSNIANVGSMIGAGIGAVNPVIGAAVTLGSQLIGGVVNGGWGHKVYGTGEAQNYLDNMSGRTAGGDNESILNFASTLYSPKKVTYKDGWFTDKGENEANEWNTKTQNAYDFAQRSVGNAIANNNLRQLRQLSMNDTYASGGALPFRHYNAGIFSQGGMMSSVGQDHGANWDTGVKEINTGSLHELNPNEGVQMGVDSEGTPNLVEEGEVIWNDYVFSNRIEAPKEVKRLFGIRGKKAVTFADVAKQLEKEGKERPNDPISKAGIEDNMELLAEKQEEIKKQREAERARAEFESMTPEEQTAVMQGLKAQQQQVTQQQAMAEQQAVAQQQGEQGEQEMLEQQTQQGEPIYSEEQMMAEGGHLYNDGGVLRLLKALGYKSTAEAEKAGFSPADFGVAKWTDINNDTKLPESFTWNTDWNSRLGKEIQARMSLGWSPLSELVQPTWYEAANGNKVGWSASVPLTELNAEQYADLISRYANTAGYADKQGWIKAPGEGETISTKEIQAAMQRTPDWIASDKWLFDDANAKANQEEYLGRARTLNDPDDQKFIDKWTQYGDFTTDDNGKTYKFKFRDNLSEDDYKKAVEMFKKSRYDDYIGVMHNSRTSVPETLTNYLYDPETGKVTGVLTDTSGYKALGDKFIWGDKDTNRSAQFWTAAEVDANTPASGDGKGTKKKYVPNYKNEKLQYVGLLGPAAGLGLWAAGVGKPDTSGLDAAVSLSKAAPIMAKVRGIGDYLAYKPFDRDYSMNTARQGNAATRRALLNSGSTPSRAAQILAADRNYLNSIGNIHRQADEYNLNQRHQVAKFNRDTNQFNAQADNQAALRYANDYNNQKKITAQMAYQAAKDKMDANAVWYNSLYGNIGQLAAGIGKIGERNANHNWMADMWAQEFFGKASPEGSFTSRYLTELDENGNPVKEKKKSYGGKVRRKKRKGLTF